MTVKEYETEEEMDADFEKEMDAIQEEQRLRDLIFSAQERISSIKDELNDAEEELQILEEKLDQLGC